MADAKISALNALTAPASDDLIPIVDTSASETKKIAVSDLLAAGVGAVLYGTAASASVTASSTQYHTFAGLDSLFNADESSRQMLVPVAGTLSKFYVRTNGSQYIDGSLILTVRVNGVDTGITITIPAGATMATFSDTTHTAAVVAGDLISIKGVNAASEDSATLSQWSIVLQ